MCSTITGYLMMGALSPGLKRHSVTLFEGGRVAGDDVVRELVDELWASYAAGQGFEDDMLRLTHYAAALGSLLEAVRASAGPGAALELLRKESLAGLAPTAAAKAQLTLQNHLTKLLLSYTHAALDGSYGSAGPQQLAAVVAAGAGEGAGGTCGASSAPAADSGQEVPEGNTAVGSAGPFSTAAATATAGSAAEGVPAAPGAEQGAAGSAVTAGAGLGAVLPLPAVNLSFDGHSLQPIRLRDSVQGLGCLCQG